MLEPQKPFVSYYKSIGFAPTGNSTTKIKEHKDNRNRLYEKLGLPGRFFRDISVLEVGPGSGENSIDLIHRGISSIKLVDAIPEILESLENKIEIELSNMREAGHRIPRIEYEIRDCQNNAESKKFDFVLCEGTIPFQINPMLFYSNLEVALASQSSMIITTSDPISSFSEVLRRYAAHKLFTSNEDISEVVKFFDRDLQALPGMTRTSENWALDTICNPWIGKTFGIDDLLDVKNSQVYPVSMTPNLIPDIRWYKEARSPDEVASDWLGGYSNSKHLLLDKRMNIFSHLSSKESEILSERCSYIYEFVQESIATHNFSQGGILSKSLQDINEKISEISPVTKQSITSYITWLATEVEGDLSEFRKLWGRGQQHVLLRSF